MTSSLPQRAIRSSLGDQVALLAVLALSSLLSVVLVAFRVYYSGAGTYIFLVWNLFLAWVPLISALALWWVSPYGRRVYLLLVIFLTGWFFFFPNSPYLVTDLLHLQPRQNIPLWYDALLIFSFAWNGLLLGLISLWIVQEVIQTLFGRWVGWLLVLMTLAASGFGIYLGRFLRWNSWDLLMDPRGLAADIATRLLNPGSHPLTLAVTLLFSAFLTVAYLTFALLLRTRWSRHPL